MCMEKITSAFQRQVLMYAHAHAQAILTDERRKAFPTLVKIHPSLHSDLLPYFQERLCTPTSVLLEHRPSSPYSVEASLFVVSGFSS